MNSHHVLIQCKCRDYLKQSIVFSNFQAQFPAHYIEMPATLEELMNKVLRDGLKAKNKALVTMAQILLKIAEGKYCLEELRSEIIHYQKQCDETNKTRDHTAPGVVEAACVIGK